MKLQDFRAKLPELNGLDDESALNVLQKVYYPTVDRSRMAEVLGVKAAALVDVAGEDRSIPRAAADTALQFGRGAVSGVRMMSDLFGANNAVSGKLKSAEDAIGNLLSAQAQGDQQRIAQIMAEADGMGWGDQITAGLKAFGVAPGAILAQAAGTSIPTLATALIPGAGPVAVGARLGMGAAIGAGQGAGAVKGQIYETVKAELLKSGATTEVAEARAVEAQAYDGANAGQIAGGGALGALAGTTGAERAVSALRNGVTKAPAGMVGRVGMGALTESIPEAAQGGQEKFAGNTALGNEGYAVDPMRGVVASATMEGVAGAGMGGVFGIPKPALPVNPAVQDPAKKAADAIRATELVPETGALTKAVNAGTEAKAQKVEAGAPVTTAADVTQAAQQRLAELDAKSKGSTDQTITGPEGEKEIVPGTPGAVLPPEELAELQKLQANIDNPQALAQQYGLELASPEAEAAAAQAPAALPAAVPVEHASPEDQAAYAQMAEDDARAQAEAEMERLAIQTEGAMGRTPEGEDSDIPGFDAKTDTLNPVGKPFKTKMAADREAKARDGEVVPVEGGFLVRKTPDAKPAEAPAVAAPVAPADTPAPAPVAAVQDSAPGPASVEPAVVAGMPEPTQALTPNVQDQPQAAAPEPAPAQAAAVEAPPAVGSDGTAGPGAAPAGPAAVEGAGVAKADLDKLTVPEMTDAQLDAAATVYGPDHKRTPKVRAEIEKRAAKAKPEAAAPATQEDPDSPAARWTRMTTAERMGVAAASGMQKFPAGNVSRKAWDSMDRVVQERLAKAMDKRPKADAPVKVRSQDQDDLPPVKLDAAGRAEQRAKLTGDARWDYPPQWKDTPASHSLAQRKIVDFMNGDITRTELLGHLEKSDLLQGHIFSFTQRLVDDAPNLGEVDAMMARRDVAAEKAAPAKPPAAKPKADRTAWADKLGIQKGDVFDFDMPGSYATGRMSVSAVESDMLRVVGDGGAGTFLKRWEVERGMADGKIVRAQSKAVTAPAPADPEAEARAKAQADLDAALGDLGDIFGKNVRASITPEQEQKLLPVLTRVMDAAFRLGYYKFKDAARFVVAAIRAKMGNEVAEQVSIDHLQGAYIGMAGKYQDKGASTKKEVVAIESLDELAPEVDKPNTQADTGGKENGNATRNLDRTGQGALEGAPPQDVRAPDEGRDAGKGADGSGRGDGAGDARADDAGGNLGGSLGGNTGAVPVPSGGSGADAKDAPKRRVSRAGGTGEGLGEPGRTGGITPESGANPAPNAPPIAAPQPAAQDFTITDELALGEGGQKTKFKNNVAAIRLMRELEESGRMATPAEQAVLAKYVGWGGLSQAFDGAHADWAKEHAEITELMSPADLAAARKSTRYAHYTSREIIVDGIYAAMRRFGFTGGKTLEAGAGVGNFIGLMPADMRSAGRFTAIEREPFSSAIARQLYPQQSVQRADFTEFKGTDAYFDAAVGNPPFAKDPQTDRSGRKHLSGLSLHNYFFAKSIDMLREGGIMAQVVTNAFLDAKGDKARRYISDRAEFLGAVRLPNSAFAKNAGTEVTTDIIFLKKRPDSEVGGKAARADAKRWLDIGIYTGKLGKPVALNQYFIDNPHMMLGDFGAYGTMYGPDQPALVARPGQDTMVMLKAAVEKLPASVYKSIAETGTATQVNAAVVALKNPSVKEGGYFVEGGKLMQRLEDIAGEARGVEVTPDTQWTAKTKLGESGFERIKALADMRGTVRALLAAEMSDDADGMKALRTKLNEQYDAYRDAHGLINDPSTLRVFDDDPDFPLLASLEHGYTPGIGPAAAKTMGIKPTKSTAKKGPIFTQRVVAARQTVQKVETPADALAVSMAERGKLDAAYIGKLLGMEPDAVLKELSTGDKPLLFRDPLTDEYVLRDAYLSGNVRAKLAQAREAGMFANVTELEAVQPEDVGSHEITARLGSPWVPTDVYRDFAQSLYGEDAKAQVFYLPTNSSFQVVVYGGSDVAMTNTWGTNSYHGDALLQAVMNNRTIKVTYRDSEGKTHTDVDATEKANDKAQQIKEKFNDWLFADPERSELLTKAYNETNNNYVTRVYDGGHMTFPGKVPDSVIKFRRHQRNAIARIVQDRTALLDHVVGAGKTFTVISGAMELKRTGLARKPMVAVPNHLVKQWASDFYRLYPGANVLTATKKDFEKANRRKFLAKIATGDWDAVVIAHSSFGFIRPAPEFEAEFNGREIQKIMATIKSVEDSDGDKQGKKRTIKQLEGMKERLENRIRALRDKPMDDLLDFEQIGVDQLFVDEAHMFKNLMFTTKMQGVAGLNDPTGSQRAYDMYVKTNQVMEKNGRGQGVVFATGTPVSNSLAEMYHMMRYLMPAQMKELGFESFDAWANTYASVEQVWMQAPSGDGFKAQNRMSNFVNTPELLKMFDQVSDTVTMDDIKKAYAEENDGAEFPLPKLKTGRRIPVSLEKSEAQDNYMAEVAKRAKAIELRKGPPQKGDDNILVVMSDARKAAMDIRLVEPDVTEREKGGRIDVSTDAVVERYKQYDAVKGTQLVFSDLGTPLKHAKKELAEYEALQARIQSGTEDVATSAALGSEAAMETMEDAEAAQAELEAMGPDWLSAVKAALRGFSIYDDFKAALIEKGIPEAEIAFIHDYNTDDQKASLFRKVNAGQIRVLLGSTAKLGAGTNVQERLVALHHLDVPWRPSDVEQREGRIERQGNRLMTEWPDFEIEILAYVTKDTLDMRMWQVQETKLKMINQLRTRKIGREIDNAFEDMELSAGEMQAAATGDINLLKEIQLRNDVKKLEQRRRAFDGQRNDLISRKRRNAESLREMPALLAKAEDEAAAVKKYREDAEAARPPFAMNIDGKDYAEVKEAQAVLLAHDEATDEVTDLAGEVTLKKRPLDVTINGEKIKNRAVMAELFSNARGDVDTIAWEVGGETYRRRTTLANAIRAKVQDAVADESVQQIGTIGAYAVAVEGSTDKYGAVLEVTMRRDGDVKLSNTISASDTGALPARVITQAENLMSGALSEASYLARGLERAKREAADLSQAEVSTEWPEQAKLDAAREAHKTVLGQLKQKKDGQPAADAPEDSDPQFSRGPGKGTMAKTAVQQVVDAITSNWGNAPDVVVVDSMQDKAVPKRVRSYEAEQRSQGTAGGEPEGFWFGGKAYIVAGSLKTPGDVTRVLFHEALGHYGLRGVFGDALEPILGQIVALRRTEVEAKAKAYKLDMTDRAQALQAAEEVLAVMAQTSPDLGYVKRAVAAVRAWLRNHVPGFAKMILTDAEIIQQFILPARRFVKGGPTGGPRGGLPAMSRALGYDAAVDSAIAAGIKGAPVERGHVAVGSVSPALMAAGLADGELRTSQAIIAKAAFDHGVTKSVLKKLPELLDQPVMVFESDTVAGRYVVVTSEFVQGRPLIVALSPEGTTGGVAFSFIPSLYPKEDLKAFERWLSSGKLRYLDKKQSPQWFGSTGLQLPGEFRTAKGLQSRSVATNEDVDNKPAAFSRTLPEALAAGVNSVRDVKLPAGYVVNDFFKSTGTLSWWHKTIGTQYNLAQRSAPFKRVFDAAQEFINDVSYFATESADKAPTILPKLESLSDITKSPLSAADNKAIAAPIFEGTLIWARGADGKPVKVEELRAQAATIPVHTKAQQMVRDNKLSAGVHRMWQGLPIAQYEALIESRYESQVLDKPGVVFTAAELKSMFKLDDKQAALYREFRAAVDSSLKNMALADMIRMAGKDAAPVADVVLESKTVGEAADTLRSYLLSLVDLEPRRERALTDLADKVLEKAAKVKDLMDRGYAPLSRFGSNSLDVVDASGERVYFGLFESKAEANKMARQMLEQFPGATARQGTMSGEEFKMFAGVSPETVELFGEMLGLDATGDEAKDLAFQEYLKLSKASRSSMKRLIHRKGIAGFSEDPGRVLAGFVYSNARQTSTALHMGGLADAVTQIPQGNGELKDAAVRLHDYVKNPQEEAQAIRGLLFAQYLGGSIASALVNITQPMAVTMPWLSQYGGVAGAAAQMARAVKDALKKTTGDAALDAAMKKAEEDGTVSPQEVFQLQAQAAGRASLKAGDGTTMGDLAAKGSNTLSKLSLAWGKLFSAAEQFNRRSTFIAAYRTAVEQKLGDPSAFAHKAVYETQFIYSKANKPRWARGAIGGTLFTFKQYSIAYVELLHRMATQGGPEGKRAALLALAVLFVLSGVGGLPFAGDADDLIDGVMQRLGYNFSSKQAKTEFFERILGQSGAQIAMRGLSGVAGVPIDISGRLGMSNLLPGTGLLTKKENFSSDLAELAGPAGDLVKRAFQATEQALSGEVGKAAVTISPLAARNAAKAVEMGQTGMYLDTKGKKVIDVDAADIAAKAIGFQPNNVARVQSATWDVQRMIAMVKMREGEIADKWAKGVFLSDSGMVKDARDDLTQWNRDNPESPIRIKMPQIVKRVREMRTSKADRIAKTAPKEIRAQVKQDLADAAR